MEVQNAQGTANDVPPNGFNSWLDFWKSTWGLSSDFPLRCGNRDCQNSAEDGAHVVKINVYTRKPERDKKVYILPLCHECNMDKEKIFSACYALAEVEK